LQLFLSLHWEEANMTGLKAIGMGLLGLVAGYILTAGALYPLFLAAAGGTDMNGGIAMGVFAELAPMGAVICALAGVVWVVWPRQEGSAEAVDPVKKRRRGIVIYSTITALVVGYFGLLILLQKPAGIEVKDAVIHFEVRAPVELIVNDGTFKPHGGWYRGDTEGMTPLALMLRTEGDFAVMSGSYQWSEQIDNMRIRVVWAPDLAVRTYVPTAPKIEVSREFRGWYKVDYIDNPKTGAGELAFNQDAHRSRYRAEPINKN
jgi:hypothetical protein